MSNKQSGSSSPFNVTTCVAIFTIISAAWLVSNRLRSSRPITSAEQPLATMGEQRFPLRLWDDPFRWKPGQETARGSDAMRLLQDQIATRVSTNANATNRPLLLAVMLAGGPYPEAREARTRSRLAVVSALGEAGYAPSDAEHIGAALLMLPNVTALRKWMTNSDACWGADGPSDWTMGSLCGESTRASSTNRFSFEWYRPRVFQDTSAQSTGVKDVLVVWLEDSSFEEDFNLRLALFLQPFLGADKVQDVALIGPRRSSDLREMLPDYDTGTNVFHKIPSLEVREGLSNVLARVRIFAASPSAMDEVLVATNTESMFPRAAVAQQLTNVLPYRSFASFCATDAQLAREVLHELKLRRVDLRAKQHLALISEWDSFYGRMLSLTYASEVARIQTEKAGRVFSGSRQFIADMRGPSGPTAAGNAQGRAAWPTNLHSFVYLRGLDGQTLNDPPRDNDPKPSQKRIRDLDELSSWQPDVNKAVGPAQFDYLSRLADRLDALQNELRVSGSGYLGAIGIVGSDVYDTLLILQALRPRFPNALFFTTDLDARLWHPDEQDWSRNVIVISGHGLELTNSLQGRIAPFRDSTQTAEYLATLAALTPNRVPAFTSIQPRRFEIARGGVIDLSTNVTPLHPTPSLARKTLCDVPQVQWAALGGLLFGILLLSWILKPVRRLTWEAFQFEAESLWFRAEDLGGVPGTKHLLENLKTSTDPLSKWLHKSLPAHVWDEEEKETKAAASAPLAGDLEKKIKADAPTPPAPVVEKESKGAASALHGLESIANSEKDQKRLRTILDFLNDCVQQTNIDSQAVECSKLVSDEVKERYRQGALSRQTEGSIILRHSAGKVRLCRDVLDCLLAKELASSEVRNKKTVPGECAPQCSVALAAASAREAALEEYQLRRHRRKALWFVSLIVLVGLLVLIVTNGGRSFSHPTGEPMSFVSGTSVWPTEMFRVLAVLLSITFCAQAYSSLQSNMLTLTRGFRLRLGNVPAKWYWRLPFTPVPQASVSAEDLWERYQQLGRFWKRAWRTVVPMILYSAFGICIMLLDQFPSRPVRGMYSNVTDIVCLVVSILALLFLTFWTMDAAQLCRWFIERLSESPAHYSDACRNYFQQLRAVRSENLLEEWIDLRLIAELTERVGRLIYYPFIIMFVLIISRNRVWDNWDWPVPLIAIFILNLLLAVWSVLILQRAARRARALGIESLEIKLNHLERSEAKSEEAQSIQQGKKLLEEMRELRSGAFVPAWENPILGAILVPSGGTVLIEILTQMFSK